MRPLGILLPLFVTFTLSGTVLADESTAEGFVKARQSELSGLVKKGESQKKVGAVFDATLDYDALAQASLRDHWNERTEAERRDFEDVLKQLVQRAYRRNIDRTMGYDVKFDGQSKEGDGFNVHTVAQNQKNAREEPVSIDYMVHRVGGAWRIEDFVTEGSSLVNNYHQQFNRIIKKDGFAELMRRMKKKLESGDSSDKSP